MNRCSAGIGRYLNFKLGSVSVLPFQLYAGNGTGAAQVHIDPLGIRPFVAGPAGNQIAVERFARFKSRSLDRTGERGFVQRQILNRLRGLP
ncbi:hypothetical protein D3C76_1528110 [compost metagenome]